MLLRVFRGSEHEQETLGVLGSTRKSQQYTPQPQTLVVINTGGPFLYDVSWRSDVSYKKSRLPIWWLASVAMSLIILSGASSSSSTIELASDPSSSTL
jgi:hypothetical protein